LGSNANLQVLTLDEYEARQQQGKDKAE